MLFQKLLTDKSFQTFKGILYSEMDLENFLCFVHMRQMPAGI